MSVTDPAFRRWAYAVSIAASAVLAAKGIIDQDFAGPLNALLAAIFGVAMINTPKNDEREN